MFRKLLQSSRIKMKGARSVNINREKLIDSINNNWRIKTCPMCGRNNWDVGTQMGALVNMDEDKSIQLGGEFMPLIPIVCNSCGNVILINPLVVGCVDN